MQLYRIIFENVNPTEDVSHFQKVGERLGSNPGGVFQDPVTNDKHYIKFYPDSQQASSEIAAASVYNLLGAPTNNPRLVKMNGKLGLATKWNDNLDKISFKDAHDINPMERSRLFHAAVLTKNWDAIGEGTDNIMSPRTWPVPHTVDIGGAFNFRAQGGHKDYDSDISEFDTLRDKDVNTYSHNVFGHLTPAELSMHREALKELSFSKVFSAIQPSGINDPASVTNTLLARRDNILKRLG